MATATEPRTLEEFLAIPEDGMDRELIRGILYEKPWLPRDRHHGVCAAQLCSELCRWHHAHADLKGEVVSRASFQLSRNPDTLVSIDIAYVGAEVANIRKQMDFLEGPPVLAVEILSPGDLQGEIDEKISLYLETGVAIVWIVHPRFKTVTVYRANAKPAFFHEDQTIDAEPHLPGFRAVVRDFF